MAAAPQKEAAHKEVERNQRHEEAEAQDLVRLAALKEKYEGANLGEATTSGKQTDG